MEKDGTSFIPIQGMRTKSKPIWKNALSPWAWKTRYSVFLFLWKKNW